jgi:hypothetical protein
MIEPFANAVQYVRWNENNCCHCKKYEKKPCEIDDALLIASATDGQVAEEIFDRMGGESGKCKEMDPE